MSKLETTEISFFQSIEQELTSQNRDSAAIEKKLISKMQELKDSSNFLAHFYCGCYLYDLRSYMAASDAFVKAITLNPNFADSYYYAGMIYFNSKIFDKALEFFLKAESLGFKNEVLNGVIGICFFHKPTMQIVKAKEYFEKQKKLFPKFFSEFRRAYAMCLRHLGEADRSNFEFKKLIEEAPRADLSIYGDAIMTMSHSYEIKDKDILELAKLINTQFFKDVKPLFDIKRNLDRQYPKVGFIFPFQNHSIADWLLDLFQARDKNFFYAAYHSSPLNEEITGKIKANVDVFRDISSLGAKDAAELIYGDEIDVLFDLRSNVRGGRADVMKLKPSAVQVSWLDSFPPSGLPEMDYTIFDKYLVPEEDDVNFNEKVYRLAHNYFYFKVPQWDIEVAKAPCFKNGFVTFASFHRTNKTNPRLFKLWAKILKQVVGSKLLIKNDGMHEADYREMVSSIFENEGIARDRLLLEANESQEAFLRKCNEVDICLDAIPLNGGSTTLRTFWMSKPCITMVGKRRSMRIGYSTMRTLGLDELIANDEEEYVRLAIELANDKDRISQYTNTLRDRLLASPMASAAIIQKDLEEAIMFMWQEFKTKNG